MRQLHVVALSEDGRHLLLAPGQPAKEGGKGAAAPKATFRVPLDARLTAAVRGELPRPGSTTAPASELTPKQIQSRLRAGESVEQIARSAGVPVARVERFAGPVEGEKARVVEAAQAAVLTRARRGASAVSLGEAVAAHLVEVEIDPAEVVWNARREDDGAWLVDASYTSRGRKKRSTWRYEPASRELTAADASSAVLGYVEPAEGRPSAKVVAARPARRRTRATPAATTRRSAAAPRVPAAVKAPDRTAKARATGSSASSRKAAGPTVASPAASARPAASPAPSRARAGAAPAARVRPPARPAAATQAAAEKAVTKKAVTKKAVSAATTKTAATSTAAAPRTATTTAPAAKAAATKAPAAKAAGTKAAGTKAAGTKAAGTKAAGIKAPARKTATATTKAPTATPAAKGRPPATTPAASPAASKAPAPKAAASKASAARARRSRTAPEPPAPSGPPQLRVVPPPDDEPRARASVPAWADVLLSTTPPSRPATPDDDRS